MSMNHRMQSSPSGGSSGGGESTDLTGKDIAIMLVTALVVVFIFGTLTLNNSSDSSGGDDSFTMGFSSQTEPERRRLDIDADEGYVSPEEATGPWTGRENPEFDPHQLSHRDIDYERLKSGDYSDLAGNTPNLPAPQLSDEERRMVNEWGEPFRPSSAREADEMTTPTLDDIERRMPSAGSRHMDFDEMRHIQEQDRQRRMQR